jgi:CarD family transcriptional regulator
MGKNLAFAPDDYVVYPSHGVGRITAIETQEIVGDLLEMYVVSFEQDRLILRVPVAKAPRSGMRKLSSRDKIQTAMNALKARPRPKRAVMWSRRAQEYEAKINSGEPAQDGVRAHDERGVPPGPTEGADQHHQGAVLGGQRRTAHRAAGHDELLSE